ncbi:MAG: hemolysin family protein [Lachnospiraceae bacterium]|nr:hemolysin family protein [Lachnospiraceae bacterium]
MAVRLVILIVLLLLSAFFSCAETALTGVNRIRVRSRAEQGDKKAVILMKILENKAKMLSCILVCNNVVNIAASAIATMLAMKISMPVGIMTGIVTGVVLIFGEVTPKHIATVYSEPVSLEIAGFIQALMFLLTPVIAFINLISRGLLLLFRIDPGGEGEAMTESELRTIVDVSHEDGVIEGAERKIINNVFDFGDSMAKDIMIPRIDVTQIDINADYDTIVEIFRLERYTRLPVYAEDTDNIVGILNMKDFFVADRENFKVRDMMREGYYTYERKKTSELMMDMRRENATVAIVINEYGASVGIITMEDLLEEIVGEIRDEYDEDEVDIIQKTGENEYLVQAQIRLDDLNDNLGTDFDSEEYDSLGGFIIERLDHLPHSGEKVTAESGATLEVVSVLKNRIAQVRLILPEKVVRDESG